MIPFVSSYHKVSPCVHCHSSFFCFDNGWWLTQEGLGQEVPQEVPKHASFDEFLQLRTSWTPMPPIQTPLSTLSTRQPDPRGFRVFLKKIIGVPFRGF
jgi:hypothetical protein